MFMGQVSFRPLKINASNFQSLSWLLGSFIFRSKKRILFDQHVSWKKQTTLLFLGEVNSFHKDDF